MESTARINNNHERTYYHSTSESYDSESNSVINDEPSGGTLPEYHHSNFESLNRTPVSNYANIEPLYEDILKGYIHSNEYNTVKRWITSASIGLFCGIVSFLRKQSTGFIFQMRENMISKYANDGGIENPEPKEWILKIWFSVIICSIQLVTISACFIVFYEPRAAGGGVAETVAFLNGILIPKTFSTRVLFAKFWSTCLAVGSGLPVGAGGPMIHMGSAVGSIVSQASLFPRIIKKLLRDFHNTSDRRDFMAGGVAGGLSAHFGAPIGGLLFVAEYLTTGWNINLGTQVFVSSICASTTVQLLESCFVNFEYQGKFGIIQDHKSIMFDVNTVVAVNLQMLFPVIVLSIIAGLLGALFTKICVAGVHFRDQYIKTSNYSYLCEPAITILFYMSVVVFIPIFFDCVPTDCDGDVNKHPGCSRIGLSKTSDRYLIQYGCPDNTFNPSATILMTTGEQLVKQLFQRGFHYQYDYQPLIAAFLVYFPISAYCNGIACSTGIIIPCLLVGALCGRIFGVYVTDVLGVQIAEGGSWVDPGAFALIGASALTAGCTRLTISLVAICMEVSNDYHFIVPIMTAVMIGKWMADFSGVAPFYEAIMEIKKLPYLRLAPRVHPPLNLFTTGQVASSPVVCVPLVITIPELARILKEHDHHAFPVITTTRKGYYSGGGEGGSTWGNRMKDESEPDHFVGLARREHLVGIIRTPRLWMNNSPSAHFNKQDFRSHELDAHEMMLFDAPEELTTRGLKYILADLTHEENKHYLVDLKPYIDTSSYSAQQTNSLSHSYDLFRSMGLRHLTVVDRRNSVVGMITRCNLLEENLTKVLTKSTMKHPKHIVEEFASF